MAFANTAWSRVKQIAKNPHALIEEYLHKIIIRRSLKIRRPESFLEVRTRALAICCYMPDRPNSVEDVVQAVEQAQMTKLEFVVTNNTDSAPCKVVQPYLKYQMPRTAKYKAVAKIIKEQFRPWHDYVIIVDDDVKLQPNFFDNYFRIVRGLGLMLSQPALSEGSHGSFLCNRQIPEAVAHLTSFVETGPLTCFDRRLVQLVSFTEGSPMGWGLDFVWSQLCRSLRYPMGVVDFTPVEHKLRGVAAGYDDKNESANMMQYLSKKSHVHMCVTYVIGQTFLLKDYPSLNSENSHATFSNRKM